MNKINKVIINGNAYQIEDKENKYYKNSTQQVIETAEDTYKILNNQGLTLAEFKSDGNFSLQDGADNNIIKYNEKTVTIGNPNATVKIQGKMPVYVDKYGKNIPINSFKRKDNRTRIIVKKAIPLQPMRGDIYFSNTVVIKKKDVETFGTITLSNISDVTTWRYSDGYRYNKDTVSVNDIVNNINIYGYINDELYFYQINYSDHGRPININKDTTIISQEEFGNYEKGYTVVSKKYFDIIKIPDNTNKYHVICNKPYIEVDNTKLQSILPIVTQLNNYYSNQNVYRVYYKRIKKNGMNKPRTKRYRKYTWFRAFTKTFKLNHIPARTGSGYDWIIRTFSSQNKNIKTLTDIVICKKYHGKFHPIVKINCLRENFGK